ncbi:hypothetical protein AMELA_G00042350 [Ameiurus melas]|uniref:Uncharacterized protein n=1 Tax=Ameiurus melas TaxID=219545 RepID=A0A7J6BAA7_AMEME|nr:hypothetical protein AMELA_G00042350 [Ameiurus melas]
MSAGAETEHLRLCCSVRMSLAMEPSLASFLSLEEEEELKRFCQGMSSLRPSAPGSGLVWGSTPSRRGQ